VLDDLLPSELLDISEQNRALAATMGIVPEIHREDFILSFLERALWKGDRELAIRNYYQLGRRSAMNAREFVDDVLRVKQRTREEWQPLRVMDFASGFGGAARHFQASFRDSKISACDIHEKAIAFNQRILGIESYLSSYVPEDVRLPEQDVIVVLSLFSHLPKSIFTRWIRALGRTLAPGGALIFTAHGHVGHKTGNFGIIVDDSGFGFRPQSEQHDLPGEQYGLTISYPRYVVRAIAECPELRLTALREGFWWSSQDTYVCVRER